MVDKRNGIVLIVDDDEDFCCLMQMAFAEAQVPNPIEIIPDGAAAINHLKSLGNTPRGLPSPPVLVLLDLRMPGVSGLEVLRWMRTEPRLANVNVVVFTGMEEGAEVARALQAQPSSLRIKPSSYRDLVREAELLRDRYLVPGELKYAA